MAIQEEKSVIIIAGVRDVSAFEQRCSSERLLVNGMLTTRLWRGRVSSWLNFKLDVMFV